MDFKDAAGKEALPEALAAIAAEGIDHVFAVMGDANQDIIVELCEKHGLKYVHAHHETAAVGMADGRFMIVRRSVASGGIAQSLRHVDSPCVSPHDFPKNTHSSVSRYCDGGENAYGAEPAGGRAKQQFSESADTKAEC
jgi:thiamine pyrophosphate-dependent enzyme